MTSFSWMRWLGSGGGRRSARWLTACFFVLLLHPAEAQHESLTTYGDAQGLADLNVHALLQDQQEVLWVGTDNGIFRADGNHFNRAASFDAYNPGAILDMAMDTSNRRLWVLGANRLLYAERGAIHAPANLQYSFINQHGVQLFVPPAGDGNGVFVLNQGTLERIDTRDNGQSWRRQPAFSRATLERYPALGHLTTLTPAGMPTRASSRRTVFWAGCGQSLCRVDLPEDGPPEVKVLGTGQGVPATEWLALKQGRDGALWARARGLLLKIDPRNGQASRYDEPQVRGDSFDSVDSVAQYACLEEDPEGRILTNLGEGLARLEDGHWHVFLASNGLPASPIQLMHFDQSGSLWLGVEGHGLSRWFGYGEWQGWTRSEGLSSDAVWDIVRDTRGRLWFATSADLDQYVAGKGPGEPTRIFPQQSGAPFRHAESVQPDARGHLWVGTNTGNLIDYDPDRQHRRVVGSDFGGIYSIYQDRQERIWICSNLGVTYFSPEDGWAHRHDVREPGAPAANAWTMVEDRAGTLWVTARDGLFRRQRGQWSHVNLPAGITEQGYPVLTAAPDGTLWMQGSEPRPLVRLRVDGTEAHLVESVDRSVIDTDALTFLAYDKRGWLWVGSDAGVYVRAAGRWIHLTQEDGLIWDDTDTNSFLADADGSVWIGTSGGISHLLDPERLLRAEPPQIFVPYIEVGGRALRPGSLTVLNQRHPTLSARLFSGDYARPDAVQFRYQIEGLDPEWQEANGNRIRLPALPAGRFRLRIEAADTRRGIESAPVDYPFEILSPWWQRTWFRIAERVGVALMVILLWRASVKLLVNRQLELESLVYARTQELENEKAELLEARATLLEMTRRDTLTGLLNRSAIFDQLARERERVAHHGGMLAVVMADLDNFKSINDTYGHMFGDAVIRECARRFQVTLRPGDAVGRYGGEELLLLIPGLRPESAAVRMEELRDSIASQPIAFDGRSIRMTCSFGLSWLEASDQAADADIRAAIASADAALYAAKQRGRNRVEFAEARVS